mmetsp:Transcript_40717/g.107863  ORF Transcript_40717/g.107863 Transcript_40717/m.107863 type:complete len:206 (-) Transcript_40717:504-1121(-)
MVLGRVHTNRDLEQVQEELCAPSEYTKEDNDHHERRGVKNLRRALPVKYVNPRAQFHGQHERDRTPETPVPHHEHVLRLQAVGLRTSPHCHLLDTIHQQTQGEGRCSTTQEADGNERGCEAQAWALDVNKRDPDEQEDCGVGQTGHLLDEVRRHLRPVHSLLGELQVWLCVDAHHGGTEERYDDARHVEVPLGNGEGRVARHDDV